MYADDTQLYFDFSPEDEVTIHTIIDECVGLKEIKEWLSGHFLLLNENKTEAITVMQVHQSAVAKSIQLGDVTVPLSCSVRQKVQNGRTCSSNQSFPERESLSIQRIRRIRDCLNFSNTKLLVHSLVTSRLDYANG